MEVSFANLPEQLTEERQRNYAAGLKFINVFNINYYFLSTKRRSGEFEICKGEIGDSIPELPALLITNLITPAKYLKYRARLWQLKD